MEIVKNGVRYTVEYVDRSITAEEWGNQTVQDIVRTDALGARDQLAAAVKDQGKVVHPCDAFYARTDQASVVLTNATKTPGRR